MQRGQKGCKRDAGDAEGMQRDTEGMPGGHRGCRSDAEGTQRGQSGYTVPPALVTCRAVGAALPGGVDGIGTGLHAVRALAAHRPVRLRGNTCQRPRAAPDRRVRSPGSRGAAGDHGHQQPKGQGTGAGAGGRQGVKQSRFSFTWQMHNSQGSPGDQICPTGNATPLSSTEQPAGTEGDMGTPSPSGAILCPLPTSKPLCSPPSPLPVPMHPHPAPHVPCPSPSVPCIPSSLSPAVTHTPLALCPHIPDLPIPSCPPHPALPVPRCPLLHPHCLPRPPLPVPRILPHLTLPIPQVSPKSHGSCPPAVPPSYFPCPQLSPSAGSPVGAGGSRQVTQHCPGPR